MQKPNPLPGRLDAGQRHLLAEAVRAGKVPLAQVPIFPRHEGEAIAPLSLAQERLWLQEQLGTGGQGVYNEPYHCLLPSGLDRCAFLRALTALARRQAVLATTFERRQGGQPVQVVGAPPRPVLAVVDLTDRGEVSALEAELAARPFTLTQQPPWRALLLALPGGEHRFLLCLHHILCDAASISLFAAELGRLYAAELGGSALPPLPIQFADYAAWQRDFQLPLLLDRELPLWSQRLAGAPTLLELPTDRPRPVQQSFRGQRLVAALPASLSEQVRRLARQQSATPFMVLLAAFGALLGRWSGRRDLLVGMPIEGRDRPEVGALIGFFVNTLVLRLDLGQQPTVAQLVARVRQVTLDAMAHPDLPFSSLVEELKPERSASHSPLVQVLCVMQRRSPAAPAASNLPLALERIDNGTAKFDLTLVLREAGGGFECGFEYPTDLFDEGTIRRLAEAYATLLDGMVTDPEQSVCALPLVARSELLAYQGRQASFGAAATAVERFAEQAAAAPDRLALVAEGEALSYGELDRRSNQLAHRLRRLGVGPEGIVGLACDPGAPMLVVLWGVLKAGAAYLPIDPRYPAERIRFLLADAGVPWLLTVEAEESKLASFLAGTATRLLVLDRAAERLAEESAAALPAAALPGNIAYQIYTSGSTGRPKGVMVEHRTLLNLTDNFIEMFRLGPDRRQLMYLSLSFDASVGDIYPPLLAGATLVMTARPAELTGVALARLCEEQQIHVLELAASFWQAWVEDLAGRAASSMPPSLDTLVVGGDSIGIDKLRQWFRLAADPSGRQPRYERRVLHNYGPTETTVCTTSRAVASGEEDRLAGLRLSIGTPIANTAVYVLDRLHLQPLPRGLPGEIAIGGAGVARGYFRRPATTAEAFVPDPFSGRAGERLYRTGDLARYLPNGELEFMGRIDQQVKVRGFRLEPGEIEAVLTEHPALAATAVLARADRPGERRLVAYVVPRRAPAPNAAALRGFLLDRLPEHLVPEVFVPLDRLPLNTHGKVDRKALPPPDSRRPELHNRMEPPRTDLERRIATVWARVLGLDAVGVEDNFFDLGGNSMRLLELQSQLETELQQEMAVADLFRFPRIAALAAHLSAHGAADRGESTSASTAQTTPPRRESEPASARCSRPGADIAIIAVSGRFPGAASPEEMWALSRQGVESIRFFSEAELLEEGFDPATLAEPRFVRAKGVVDRPTWFDTGFFGIPPREAEIIDPQHRLVLECSWEAFERAGYDPHSYPGSVGVLVGVGRDSYLVNNLLTNREIVDAAGVMQLNMANAKEYAAKRVAYKFDLKGPAMAIQTACSTSLVAVHMACRLLRAGDCDLALAGGATITFPERAGYLHLEGGIFSNDGHCRAFDETAKGVVPGNGVALVLLKRLEDAEADGDPILAVIRGSGITQDGSLKMGWSAPSVNGQVRAIRSALGEAGLGPGDVSFIETHGTGTLMGDLAEAEALKEGYREPDSAERDCAIASLKTNLGHLDTAAGAASLIRATFVLRNGEIPPSLHFRRPNPKIVLEKSRLFVNTELRAWPAREGPRRAAVNSLGLGGTNAHVIVEEAPTREPSAPGRASELLVLSARSAHALDLATENLAAHLEAHSELALSDVAYTLQVGRRRFEHRRAVVAADRLKAVAALRQAGQTSRAASPRGTVPSVVFLFPGSGAQYLRMGEQLYRTEPIFRREITRVAELMGRYLVDPASGAPLDLLGLLYHQPENEALARQLAERTVFAQPALFAVEWALAQLWLSWGIRPAAMIGHSLGEYTAACLAGVFRLEEAAELVARRGQWIDALRPGATTAVPLSERELRKHLGPELDISAVNLPELSGASGPVAAVAALEERLAAEGIECRRIHIDFAAHSAELAPMLAQLRPLLESMTLEPPQLPFVSNLTGTWITDREAVSPEYWLRQVRQTVRFSEGLSTLLQGEERTLLEVGPGRTLTRLAARHPSFAHGHRAQVSMRHAAEAAADSEVLLTALGELWVAGAEPDWQSLHAGSRRYRVELPTYPFERRSYFVAPPKARLGDTTSEEARAPATSLLREQRYPRPELSQPYAPPRDETEAQLCQIWEDLLGVAPVGIHDNFFELGGDSVISLQVVHRGNRQGLNLTQRKVFHHVTIAELALATLIDSSIHAQQSAIHGQIPLMPIQQWFFARDLPEKHHWNLALMLALKRPALPGWLRGAVVALVRHHDGLRLQFSQTKTGWVQAFGDIDSFNPHLHVDLGSLAPADRVPTLERLSARAQTDLQLGTGGLVRFVSYELGDGQPPRLLMVVHHLVFDAISLRIVLEDLETGLSRSSARQPIELPLKTSSLMFWSTRLPEHVRAGALDGELAYWLAPERETVAPLPLDLPGGANRVDSAQLIATALSPELTQWLLREAPRRLRCEINDLLLAALALSFEPWLGEARLLVDLEGHGRDPILKEADLTRTVGWFTTSFPLLLALPPAMAAAPEAVATVRAQLQAVPRHGVGYGLLRWLAEKSDVAARLAALPQAEVSFLYLGQFDQAANKDGWFQGAPESAGPNRSRLGVRSHGIEINSFVSKDTLQVHWTYSDRLHHRATIAALGERYCKALEALAATAGEIGSESADRDAAVVS